MYQRHMPSDDPDGSNSQDTKGRLEWYQEGKYARNIDDVSFHNIQPNGAD